MTAINPFCKILYLASLLAGTLIWAPPGWAADVRVGYVNVPKVLEEAPQTEDALGRLEREFAPKDRELVAQQKEIRKMEDKLVRDGAVMAESARNKLDREIRSLKRELRRLQEEFREDFNVRRNEENRKVIQGVIEATRALGKAEKYDIILTDGVIFAGKGVEITDKVIQRMKADFKRASRAGGTKR